MEPGTPTCRQHSGRSTSTQDQVGGMEPGMTTFLAMSGARRTLDDTLTRLQRGRGGGRPQNYHLPCNVRGEVMNIP